MIKGIVAGYWDKNGLALYRYVKGKPVLIAAGSLEDLKPIRGAMLKTVLIVGRDRLLHVRKRYPPAPKEDLFQAVSLELGELFPFNQPDYFCRVFQSFPTFTEIDIWAWESESYDHLKKILPFHYVIPEDLAFPSAGAEIFIWTHGNVTNLMAAAEGRFLNAISHPAHAVTEEEVARFLKSLEPYVSDKAEIRIYGEIPVDLKPTSLLAVIPEAEQVHSPCLNYLPAINLREFRIRGKKRIPVYQGLLFRVLIYCILGYGLVLYLNIKNYEKYTREFQQASRQLDQSMLLAEKRAGKDADYSEALKELKERLKAQPSPTQVMDMMARTLPEGSSLGTVFLSDYNLEVWIMSNEPLAVLKALSQQKEIRTVKLKGPFNMEQKSGQYSFSVAIELAG